MDLDFKCVLINRLIEKEVKFMIEGDANALIEQAVKQDVSDIHILPTRSYYQIYFRINGQLNLFKEEPLEWGKRLISYFKFLADMDVGEKRRPQSGSTAILIKEKEIELRFSTITNIMLNESIVIRVLKQERSLSHTIQTYFPKDINILRQLIQRKSGLILFSGPVGSGKTTTIYQLLRERVSNEPLQIITMEDPVEIYEEAFLQTEINEKADITYDQLIKSSLRHHPDILMIGEVRDEETARMIIRGALTGHLMIATIHAKNALGVIARLQELNVTEQQLKQTLIGVISQRLVPRYCTKCKGACSVLCSNIAASKKRAAILEVLHGNDLINVLSDKYISQFPTINHKLRKAWAYGYIDQKTYRKFEII